MEIAKIQYGKYSSILNVFKRDPQTKKIIRGMWACPEFEYLQDCEWDFFEKINGMNVRVIIEDGKMSRRGRTDKAQLPGPLFKELDGLFGPYVEKFKSVCFYGEGYGGKIQKGGKYQTNQGFILFDIKIGDYFVVRSTMNDIANNLLIDTVPLVFSGTLQEGIDVVADGLCSSLAHSLIFAEGLVGRPRIPLHTRWGGRVQVKIKHRDFYCGCK